MVSVLMLGLVGPVTVLFVLYLKDVLGRARKPVAPASRLLIAGAAASCSLGVWIFTAAAAYYFDFDSRFSPAPFFRLGAALFMAGLGALILSLKRIQGTKS